MDIPDISRQQDGCFLTRQALDSGWTKHALRTAKDLEQVGRGVWIRREALEGLTPPQQHRIDLRADLLRLGPGWHAARRSAAFVSGLPLLGADPGTPQLLRAPVTPQERSWHTDRWIAPLPERQRGVIEELPITKLDRIALDIARGTSEREGLVVADAVLGLGVDPRWLHLGLTEMARWPGAEQARKIIDFADGLSESPLESISRLAFEDQGLPRPELQVEVWRGRRLLGRADFLWREHLTVGEADGVAKYGSTDAARRAAFVAGKRRAESLSDGGLQVTSWGWDDAWSRQDQLAEQVRRAFARGDRQTLDPDIHFVPTTVDDRLRRNR